MSGFRYRQDPRANETFGLAVLQAIATHEDLAVLRRALVLKGGAALLHVYGSGRATRTDLDFDVQTNDTIAEGDVLRLLAHLQDPWGAAYATGRREGRFEAWDDAVNIGPIAYRRVGSNPEGALLLQVSQRQIPPRMAEFIANHDLVGPDGRKFAFPIMPLEVIAGEKAFRSVSTKGPHITDEYDIGYILERVDNRGPIKTVFDEICLDERRKIDRHWNDKPLMANYESALAARQIEDLFVDRRVLDPGVGIDVAKQRVAHGIAFVRELAGLSVIPAKGTAKVSPSS